MENVEDLKKNPVEFKKQTQIYFKDINISKFKFTHNGNLLIFFHSQEDYDKIKSLEKIFNDKKIIALENKKNSTSVVLKGISFEDAKEFEQELEEIGIVSYHKIKSFKYPNSDIKKVKLVCDNEMIAQNLLDNGITLNYIHYHIKEFKITVKIVQCYTCQKLDTSRRTVAPR